MNVIEKINTFGNFELLKNESINLVNTLNLTQISLQVTNDNISWTQSEGWLSSKMEEFNFNAIHPKLKNTVFEEYITTSPIKLYRTRIMVLKSNASYFRNLLSGKVNLGECDSWVVIVNFGNESKTLQLNDYLQKTGLDTSIIQFPAVPKGEARIRMFITSEHSEEQLNKAAEIILKAADKFDFLKK